jgi:hypothetical protein
MVEPTTFLMLIDKLKEFLSLRSSEKAIKFEQYVEPLYRDAEIVYSDYASLFRELVRKLSNREPSDKLEAWLEERRAERWPLREKIRAVVELRVLGTSDMTLFERGIWGLLRGSASVFQDGHTDMRDYGWGDHTVKDLLRRWRNDAHRFDYQRLEHFAERQARALENAWSDVAAGYAELKGSLLHGSKPSLRSQTRRSLSTGNNGLTDQ